MSHNQAFVQTRMHARMQVCAWAGNVAKQLQGCFECTDWDMFFHSIE